MLDAEKTRLDEVVVAETAVYDAAKVNSDAANTVTTAARARLTTATSEWDTEELKRTT